MPTIRILLTGATGNVGGAALRALLQRPSEVELVVAARDPDRARPLLALDDTTSVAVVPFDFTKPATIAPALRGVTSLLLVRPPAISDVQRYLRPVIEAALAAGVGQVVFPFAARRTVQPVRAPPQSRGVSESLRPALFTIAA